MQNDSEGLRVMDENLRRAKMEATMKKFVPPTKEEADAIYTKFKAERTGATYRMKKANQGK